MESQSGLLGGDASEVLPWNAGRQEQLRMWFFRGGEMESQSGLLGGDASEVLPWNAGRQEHLRM